MIINMTQTLLYAVICTETISDFIKHELVDEKKEELYHVLRRVKTLERFLSAASVNVVSNGREGTKIIDMKRHHRLLDSTKNTDAMPTP